MKNFVRLLLASIMSLSWIQSSASSYEDTTRLYPIEIWKIRTLVAIAERVPVQDSLIAYQQEVIRLGIRAQASTDSVLVLTRKELEACDKLTDSWKEAYNLQLEISAELLIAKRKWVWRFAGAVLFALLLGLANFLH